MPCVLPLLWIQEELLHFQSVQLFNCYNGVLTFKILMQDWR